MRSSFPDIYAPMEIYLKLGSLPRKRYQTRDYKSIEEGDIIEVQVQGKWQKVKIWELYDDIPVRYFGGYL